MQFPGGSVETHGSESAEPSHAIIKVQHEDFFRRLTVFGEIGLGEGYMAGDWESPDVPRVLRFFVRNMHGLNQSSGHRLLLNMGRQAARFGHWLRRNTRGNSLRNISAHYDLSNDFYSLWLDPTWTYSSARFDEPGQSLEDAQEGKYRNLAEHLQLQPGQRILEIGCGWGGNAIFLARNYGVHVTGLTISTEQLKKARERVRLEGLEDQVDLRFCDYRDADGCFDAIVSVEMLEAVGHQFLRTFFHQCHRLLRPSGLLGLQVILSPDARYHRGRRSADWIKKHIFPGGQLPSFAAINRAINCTGDLNLAHFETMGLHYARTLQLWRERFLQQVSEVRQLGFDDRFIRKWVYYLSYCQAAFETANINVAQMIYVRPNRPFA